MVRIIEIDIGRLGLSLPLGNIGMVIAQPYVDLVAQAPFTIVPELRESALAGIDATMAVALSCPHNSDKTHFTIFPECALPGLTAFDHITAKMTDVTWPKGSVVIGGLEGLTKAQFGEIIQRPNTSHDNEGSSLDRIRPDHWVNCCVTWVKLESGEVRAYIQTKIAPAGVELNVPIQSMFQGNSIFLFKGTYAGTTTPYRFASLICFDWIGTKGQQRIWQWLLQYIDQKAGELQAQLPLTWLFVAQCNPDPSHTSFMNQVQPFFDTLHYPSVLREDTCLVMANVAGKNVPGRADRYGLSSVIFASQKFSKPDNPPTYCSGGIIKRPGNPLENFKDSVFRERGACIHSFTLLNPRTLPPGAAGKRFALAEATVHPFPGTSDPRAPNGLVPAVVKWINDELDDSGKSIGANYSQLPLANTAGAAHQRLVVALRVLPPVKLNTTLLVACPTADSVPDQWNTAQSQAIKHVLNTFSILEAGKYPANFHGNGTHATIMKGSLGVEVVAVAGRNHEECDKHVLAKLPDHRGQLLLVSRDEDNTSWDPRMRTLFDQAAPPTKELNITDPTSAVIRVGYHDVLRAFQLASNQSALKEAIDAAISSGS